MIIIEGNHISLVRGDSATINLTIKDKKTNQEYILEVGDIVRFSVKKEIQSHDIVIQKQFNNNEIVLDYEDTKDLSFGDYVYDVELQYSDGQRDTIIRPSTFTLLSEVHNS